MDSSLIKKKILNAGKKIVASFQPGSKVLFHFAANTVVADGTPDVESVIKGDLLDDSHNYDQPVEILIGKKFKLEVWESIIQTMAVGEVAEYHVNKDLCLSYPIVAKTFRDTFGKKKNKNHDHQPSSHCCGAMAMTSGLQLGYDDLNQLAASPVDLIFTVELLSYEAPETYNKELWQMDEKEKLEALPKLKESGNKLYRERRVNEAAKAYAQALGILEQLLLKEKPGTGEWKKLYSAKIPFLLNYSQCQLILGNYYDVIEQCTHVLQEHPDNVKALYRRGLAHIKAWNPSKAEADLQKAAAIDPSLKVAIQQELDKLDKMKKEKNKKDGAWLRQVFGNT